MYTRAQTFGRKTTKPNQTPNDVAGGRERERERERDRGAGYAVRSSSRCVYLVVYAVSSMTYAGAHHDLQREREREERDSHVTQLQHNRETGRVHHHHQLPSIIIGGPSSSSPPRLFPPRIATCPCPCPYDGASLIHTTTAGIKNRYIYSF
jgi:hypothetical protein